MTFCQVARVLFLKRLPLFLGVFLAHLVVDQWTKQLATAHLKGVPRHSWLGDTFRLEYATNDGAFLSLGGNLPPTARFALLTVGVGLLLLGLSIYALVSTKLHNVEVAGYALIASGGFSNWVDRARFDGSVVDFMNMGIGSLRTGVFNVADLAIIAGIVVLFIHGSAEEKKRKQAEDAKKKTDAAPQS